jgi:DNA repair exonuclease SbcCD nuclease subunit
VTSLSILKEYPNVEVIGKPTMMDYDGTKLSAIPWVSNDDEFQVLKQFYKDNPHDITFGHFEINNFEVVPGHVYQDGVNSDFFKNFQQVISGHFHTRQKRGNINYLGTPYEMNWNDFSSPKGINIFNTDDRSWKFIENKKTIHQKLYYDEDKLNIEKDLDGVEGKIIRLYVLNKTKDALFSTFLYELESRKPNSFIIIENEVDTSDVTFDGESKSVCDIIDDYLVETGEENPRISKLLKKIYNDVIVE